MSDPAASPTPPGTGGVPRRILLADCDMFFVQVAKLEDPEGVGRLDLVLVGGRPEGRGVVTSASYGARRFGVRSGMPMSQAVRLCPGATVVPVPRGACSRRSREVEAVLRRFAPVVEAASIDEFYLDLTGTERLYGGEPLERTAERIRRVVRDEAGISVSLGGGTTRTIAKMATRLAKPEGIHVVPAGGEQDFMLRWEVGDLPSVGPVMAEGLRRRGVRTVREALALDEDTLVGWLGESRGRWLFRRVRGIDPTPVGEPSETKSVSHERTFARDLRSDEEVGAELLRLATETGATLRRKGLRGRTVTVRVRDADFRDRQASRTLPDAVESDRAIHATARALLARLRAQRAAAVRLLGVGVSGLAPTDGPGQMALFETAAAETERDRSLSRAADAIRARFGAAALQPGRILGARGAGDAG
ncbi:MAG TPA: DNA polymerase IV [Longimicrobiaceae bacterium]|nr:DNA polymerase IV [Longimicrobiaceae bacterium]